MFSELSHQPHHMKWGTFVWNLIQEENHGIANPNLVEEPEEDGLDIHDNVTNHLKKMSEYKNWVKVLKT